MNGSESRSGDKVVNDTYRPDIDGLRALAVISVVIYHFNKNWLTGGFLGVDMFFVISGFLITGVLYTEIAENRFSISSFYVRRIRRILPAFYFMVFLTLLVGFVVLLPYDFYKLGISALSTLFFSSNFNYAFRSGGYFDSSSEQWPLLHSWSLAVEEQYYFVIPLLMVFAVKKLKLINNLVFILFVMAALSLYLASFVFDQGKLQKYSYYMLPTRGSELLIGSITAVLVKQRRGFGSYYAYRNVTSLIALCVVLFSFVLVDSAMVFPGVLYVPICLATAVILYLKGSWVKRLLSMKFLVYIGLISYSLYLFHWPVLAFSKYLGLFDGNGYFQINYLLCAAVVLILSLFSYYYVEKPARKAMWSKRNVFLIGLVFPSLVIGVLSSSVIMGHGLFDRFTNERMDGAMAFSHLNKLKCPLLVNLGCIGGNEKSDHLVVLYGNSHAEHYFDYFDLLLSEFDKKLKLVATGGCGVANYSSSKCRLVNDYYNNIAADADTVIIAQRWDTVLSKNPKKYLVKLSEVVSEAKINGSKVVIMAQVPKWSESVSMVWNCTRLLEKCNTSLELDGVYNESNMVMEVFSFRNDVTFWNPYYEMTASAEAFNENGLPLFFDDNHLSRYGALALYINSKDRAFENEKLVLLQP